MSSIYRQDRSEEDWSFLGWRTTPSDLWNPAKYMSLGKADWYASLGGEVRLFYENYQNYRWGAGPQDSNGFLLTRVLGHGDLRLGPRARVFVEFKSGLLADRRGGPRPPDVDRLDVGQAFVEVAARRKGARIDVRLGRQELAFGDGTLVAIRELNVRRGFDGARGRVQAQHWQADAFWVRPATTKAGFFDDATDSHQTFWGVHATRRARGRALKGLSAYYFGLTRDTAAFFQGSAPERRHSIGMALDGQLGPVGLSGEGTVQFGRFGSGRIWAWKYAYAITHAWPGARLRPVVALLGATSSGDVDAREQDLQTFHPLFPKGVYYGPIDANGSLNAIVIHPQATLQVSRSTSLQANTFLFWRQRASDGLYALPGGLLRPAAGAYGRHVGNVQDAEVVWNASSHTTLRAFAAYYWAGEFLRSSNLPGRDTTYAGVMVGYKF